MASKSTPRNPKYRLHKPSGLAVVRLNGADETRTRDLLHAMQALSQLSYGPIWKQRTLPCRPAPDAASARGGTCTVPLHRFPG